MQKLPKISNLRIDPQDVAALSRWLTSWTLERELHAQQGDDPAEASETDRASITLPDDLVSQFDDGPTLAVGQIRLLSPAIVKTATRPIFIAVLKQFTPDSYLAAPYSRFAVPAIPEELITGHRESAVAVLCLWNTRILNTPTISQSWFVDIMSEAELTEALSVYDSVASSVKLPATLCKRVGPVLIHMNDPRHEYMDEEAAIWNLSTPELQSEPIHAKNIIQFNRIPQFGIDQSLRLAADTGGTFRQLVQMDIPALNTSCLVFTSPTDAERLIFIAADANGEPATNMDGVVIKGASDTISLGVFSGFQAEIHTENTGLSLSDRDGNALSIFVTYPYYKHPAGSFIRNVAAIAANPESVSVLTDDELKHVSKNMPHISQIRDAVLGELFVRCWLYAPTNPQLTLKNNLDVSQKLFSSFVKEIHPIRTAEELKKISAPQLADDDIGIWRHIVTRISIFLRSDGIIPVIAGKEQNTAIPIPFTIRRHESPDAAVRDMDGIPIPQWCGEKSILASQTGLGIGIQLGCSIQHTDREFDGDSFELPVTLALARQQGKLPDYDSLSVIATGELTGETVSGVGNLEAKLALSKRMGVKLFVAPGITDSETTSAIVPGTSIGEVLEMLAGRLDKMGIGHLDAHTACLRMRFLNDDIHRGIVSMSEARTRIERYEKALLADPDSKMSAEGLIRARVLKASIANHTGDPEEGNKLSAQSAELARTHRMPLLYVNAQAGQVVSLADLGFLDESEKKARELLTWVKNEFPGTSDDQLKAEMIACGVLGGQPLLFRALQDANCGPESLNYLRRAFDLAKALNLPDDICRDSAQIALWHALLDPAQTAHAVKKSEDILMAQPRESAHISRDYLNRIRYLGAYRNLLITGRATDDFSAWPLPSKTASTWILSTTLKYRGTLLAHIGKPDEAMEAFQHALDMLRPDTAPLMRFIAGTVALQAAESLPIEQHGHTEHFAGLAVSIFTSLQTCQINLTTASRWLKRSKSITGDRETYSIPHPQLIYQY